MSAALAAAVSEYSASSTSSSDLSSSAASMDVSHDPDNANDPSKDGSISHSAKGAHSSAALSSTHECGQPDTGASDTPATSSDTDDYDHQEQERDRGEGFVLDQEQDDDEDESKLSAWTRWYLSKDLEWRRRSRQQLQARTDARYGRSAAEEQETRRRAEAKRAFDAWLALKAEDDTLRRSRERHERAEAEHERAKAQRRSREISERKCGEWAARKQEQGKSLLLHAVLTGTRVDRRLLFNTRP
ncbi:uncharacterized protein LOC144167645 [Haemaphysalis longicornis]